jgi:diketogulonate reductase-like aldo/keto reductase
VTVPQVIFKFARQVGMLPLTGTRSPEHLRADLAIDDFELAAEELAEIDRAGER